MEGPVTFPFDKGRVHVLAIALQYGGCLSAIRDTAAIRRLCDVKWPQARIDIATDRLDTRVTHPRCTYHYIRNKTDLLVLINRVASCGVPNLLFTLSSHGYSQKARGLRAKRELNGRSEYIVVNGSRPERVYDYELFQAFYGRMKACTKSLCLIDTCHSGTMLDLEYLSTDGIHFRRTRTPLLTRPLSVCISACNDSETAGEDISEFAGWGGKLICAFVDYANTTSHCRIVDFYRQIAKVFSSQRIQRSHPVLSCNNYTCGRFVGHTN